MGEIIDFKTFKKNALPESPELLLNSEYDTKRIERVRDHIEHALEEISKKEDLPLTVAMSAGRFAAMRMFQLQGRAETMAFLDQCVITAELCDDLVRQLDEDA
jgi:hypothetical protein